MFLSDYSFDKYKTPDVDKINISDVTFITQDKQILSALNEIEIICTNTLLCRNLINESSCSCTPTDIVDTAVEICNSLKMKINVLDEKQLKKLGFNLLLAVAKGSVTPPRLIVMTYTGDSKSKDTLALIGKGITFDSGGINYKTTNLEMMRTDMAGAAAVIYTLKTASELKLKANVIGVIPLTENMLSNDSFRPGDVYYSYSGKSVEIGNTDAEGRLILADAIEYTLDKLKPSLVVDLATLTGACVLTFGETIAAILSNNEELTHQLMKSSQVSGEKIWPLPIFHEHEENMKSDIADICNMPQEKNSATIHAAAFLKSFVGDIPWAHIDIAGTARYTKARTYRPKYATGFGVRLLVEFIRNLQ
jgi:leucyl aminopeptidase